MNIPYYDLQGIRVLKFYAWEKVFNEKVAVTRSREVKLLRQLAYLKGVNMFILMATPVLVWWK